MILTRFSGCNNFSRNFASFNGKISGSKKIIEINKNDHQSFNEFIEKIEKAFKESIVLTKK